MTGDGSSGRRRRRGLESVRNVVMSGVEEVATEPEKVDVLETSMHSLNISEQCEEQEAELEAANDLRNSIIEVQNEDCWENEDSDEEFFPFIYLRSGTAAKDIDKLQEISIDEAVLDLEMPPVVEQEQPAPNASRIEVPEDIVGKKASICYHDNLLSLARY
ncbi:hypothetical protein WMY93_029850 [Mugilogobius chulae]|uniref:Uncharacterized protein n=1 Tax=Mugilogobius chulae TaxID=88201 RepID=A0AAW0MSD6_9GOBI